MLAALDYHFILPKLEILLLAIGQSLCIRILIIPLISRFYTTQQNQELINSFSYISIFNLFISTLIQPLLITIFLII